ncbi:MAG: hypothetical protein U5K71_04505 [Gracilimonas sp.]|nr:hypothetical protein [Gracilimonas sp.]
MSAQKSNTWQFYPSFYSVNSLSAVDNEAVITTGGGIIIRSNDEIQTLGIADGLYINEALAALLDIERDLIYTGYADGTIDVIDNRDQTIRRLDDIRRVERFDSKSINSFKLYDNSLLVGTDFGIVEYDLNSFLVKNSYFRFGSLPSGIGVNDLMVHNDSLYVTTTQGVAIAAINDELNNNSVWTTYNESNGLNSSVSDKIVTFTDSVYVLNNRNISAYRNGNWGNSFPEINDEIIDLSVSSNQQYIAILSESSVYVFNQNYVVEVFDVTEINGKNTVGITTDKIIIGTEYTGIYYLDRQNNDLSRILPEGPQFNYLNKLLIDSEVFSGNFNFRVSGI